MPAQLIRRSATRGFALIELMLVFVIGFAVIALSLLAAARKEQDAKIATAMEDIPKLMSIADSAYAGGPGYSTNGAVVSMSALQGAVGDLPGSFTPLGGNNFETVWNNGVVSMTAMPSGSDPVDDLLSVTITRVPKDVCVRLVGALGGSMYDTTVNGQLIKLYPPRDAEILGRDHVEGGRLSTLCGQQRLSTLRFRRMKPVKFTMLRSQPMMETVQPGMESCAEPGCFLPSYNRVESAMDQREQAQIALP